MVKSSCSLFLGGIRLLSTQVTAALGFRIIANGGGLLDSIQQLKLFSPDFVFRWNMDNGNNIKHVHGVGKHFVILHCKSCALFEQVFMQTV